MSRVIPLSPARPRGPKPEWLKVRAPGSPSYLRLRSLMRELGAEQDLDAFASTVARRLGDGYERRPVETPPEEILGSLALEAA